uniref:TBC1 domain family member 24 n=1 Tax=Corvus moneduloides TaxID=1196302 RepID=A0A8U7P651_CORMO
MPEPQQPAQIPRDVLSRPPKELKRLAREGCWAGSHAGRARLYPRLIQQVSCRLVTPDALVYRDVAGRLFGKPSVSSHPLPEFLEGCPMPTYCLSPHGVTALKKILICVGALFPDITHSPLLPALAALLLHYSEDEAQCFESVSRLIASNAPHAGYIDQSFLAHQASCMTFGDLANKHCPAAHKLIAGTAKNVLEVYSEWLSWLFPGLPFGYAVRVLDVFLLEGQKVLYRIALALLKQFRLSVTPAGLQGSDIKAELQAFVRNIAEHVTVDKLLERAFGIRLFSRKEIWLLQMANRKALMERGITVVQRRPSFHLAVDMQNFSSSTVTAQEMRLVWSWIPERFSLFPPLLLFSTSEHGCSLQRFYTCCEGYEPTVLLIKTTEGEVCGAFLSSDWSERKKSGATSGFFGTGECFVFTVSHGLCLALSLHYCPARTPCPFPAPGPDPDAALGPSPLSSSSTFPQRGRGAQGQGQGSPGVSRCPGAPRGREVRVGAHQEAGAGQGRAALPAALAFPRSRIPARLLPGQPQLQPQPPRRALAAEERPPVPVPGHQALPPALQNCLHVYVRLPGRDRYRWRGRPSSVPGRQPAPGTHGALRDLRQPPALPGELPGAALGSVGLPERVVPVGTRLVCRPRARGPLPALATPGRAVATSAAAPLSIVPSALRSHQITSDQITSDQIRSALPVPWREGEAVPGPGLRALPLGTFEVPSRSLNPAHATQCVPVWGAGGEASQSGVSHTLLACLQRGAQQTSGSTGRFCGNSEPGRNPTPSSKAHQKHSQIRFPLAPSPAQPSKHPRSSAASVGIQDCPGSTSTGRDSSRPWLEVLPGDGKALPGVCRAATAPGGPHVWG